MLRVFTLTMQLFIGVCGRNIIYYTILQGYKEQINFIILAYLLLKIEKKMKLPSKILDFVQHFFAIFIAFT